MKKNISFILFLSTFFSTFGQPTIQWSKKFGGGYNDFNSRTIQLSNSNFLTVGSSESISGDINDHRGSAGLSDIWILNFDSSGNIIWKKSYGGNSDDFGIKVASTIDNGFILLGTVRSNTVDVSGLHVFGGGPFGSSDIWVAKLDSLGHILWQKCLGSDGSEVGIDIKQTSDSGYIVLGQSMDFGGDISINYGSTDLWLAKLNSSGDIIWSKTFGSIWPDYGSALEILSDGNYLLTGGLGGNGGNVLCNNTGNGVWIIKVDPNGNEIWQKCYGGSAGERGVDVVMSDDSGYFIGASTESSDGDVIGFNGLYDFWIVKCDSAGSILWQKCIEGLGYSQLNSIAKCMDNGIIACGYTQIGLPGNPSNNKEALIVKLDSYGNVEWQQTYGGSLEDEANSIIVLQDSSYLFSGTSNSVDGDITNFRGAKDYWIVKLNSPSVGISEQIQIISDVKGILANGSLIIKFKSDKSQECNLILSSLIGEILMNEKIFITQGINEYKFPVSTNQIMSILRIENEAGTVSKKFFQQ